ncbi:SulP family inorganic anion transporter [Chelatococcus asaccharovorans]|uniref:SulP family inorganic anion transporter n=1 Tax=Chelatococcus asaccharovorans TaxID=28210 RepID=UPI00224C7039|nr:SulP family inorganic anion transporter [Chelatococcus asaccharovorans]CAH1663773.1 Sulfate permease [Chelatococcus asaccharovorans]CAH1682657.1 Sulfate permease [Chelatococcus asaccharovorans]
MRRTEPGRWPVPFSGLRSATLSGAPREIAAGITLAALIIPLNIGYAQVAGLPPTAGLYAAIIPLVVFALLTSSRHLITSPDASLTALASAALIGLQLPDSTVRYDYMLAMALVAGGLFFMFWAFRLAFLANFLSRPVMAGFVSGLGLEVFVSQVFKILGAPHIDMTGTAAATARDALSLPFETTGFFLELATLARTIPHANLWSVVVGLAAFFMVRLLKRFAPAVPGSLVVLAILTVLVGAFGLDQKGVSVLGAIPSGLPQLTFPRVPLSAFFDVLPAALAVVAITLCEGLLLSRRYSRKYGYKADGNQVLFAFGAANVSAALSGAFLTAASPSRTAAMDTAGQQSQLPSLVAAVTITIVMLFFTDILAYLPNAALAGIVANAVIGLVSVSEFRDLWRMRKTEFWIAAACFLSVLVLGPMQAVLIAVLMSIIDVVGRASRPESWLLAAVSDGSHFEPVPPGREDTAAPLLVYRFGTALYFANANTFLEDVEAILESRTAPLVWFVLDAEAISELDTTGAETLHQVAKMLDSKGVTLIITRASPALVAQFGQLGLHELVAEAPMFPTNRQAMDAFRNAKTSRHGRGEPA